MFNIFKNVLATFYWWFYRFVFLCHCRCHCGHGRVLPCFQVEDCIMLQRNPRGLHIHRNQAGDWNSVIQHSFPWLSHTLCCMAREKRQAKSFEQRITSLSDSCFCDYTCTHDSTHYQCSTDLHRHSLLKLSSSSSSTLPSTLQSSEFASFKWAVTIQPQHLSLFIFMVLLPADGFDWSWTIPIFSLSPYSLATSTRSSSLFEKSDMPATSLIMCHTRWHTDYHLCEFFSSHS